MYQNTALTWNDGVLLLRGLGMTLFVFGVSFAAGSMAGFALALVKGGRDRIGETLYVPMGEQVVAVTVAGPVLYDPEGTRRDG